MKHIVKRKGHTEKFDERKLYASIYAALVTLRTSEEEAETISYLVTDEIKTAIAQKQEVTARFLHTEAVKCLRKYHPNAAYLYDTHRDLS